jgi:hypothetical protein
MLSKSYVEGNNCVVGNSYAEGKKVLNNRPQVDTSATVTNCECKRFGSIAVLREMSEKFVVKSACEAGLVIKYIGALVSVILLLFFIVITFTQTKVNARSLYHNKLECLSLTCISILASISSTHLRAAFLHE